MAKPVHLSNGRQWRTRTDALEHFKQILARYNDGDRITDPPDHDELQSLLARYDSVVSPGSETKTGSGIKYFSRQRNADQGWTTSGLAEAEAWSTDPRREEVHGAQAWREIEPLAVLRVLNVRRERLEKMTVDTTYGEMECVLEGFPGHSPIDSWKCSAMRTRALTSQPRSRAVDFEYSAGNTQLAAAG